MSSLPRQILPLHYLSTQAHRPTSLTITALNPTLRVGLEPHRCSTTHPVTCDSTSMARQKQHNPPPAKRPSPTHFLALPLNTPSARAQLERSLKIFRDAVVDEVHQPTASRDSAHPPTATGASTTEAGMRAPGADNVPTRPTYHDPAQHAKEETSRARGRLSSESRSRSGDVQGPNLTATTTPHH